MLPIAINLCTNSGNNNENNKANEAKKKIKPVLLDVKFNLKVKFAKIEVKGFQHFKELIPNFV